jgi:hypothetical protein
MNSGQCLFATQLFLTVLVEKDPKEPDPCPVISLFINLGMWYERFNIIVTR